ncbi:DUF397 domain-containing protein [Kitasatospora sp. NPDC056181]|uniref:DUF397 domain-containing protein n=1 Tax=Kitasatospora sp. NPDC056181 TaxID=3345737 RepID=UPI0035E112BC
MVWRKSSWSNDSGNCIELAIPSGPVTYVRDSTNPSGPALLFSAAAHAAFIAAVANGEFDFDLL